MCTTQEGLSFMQPRKKGISKLCMKCGSSAAVVVRGHDPLCRSCFLTYVTHKFRSTLGKAKVIRQNEKVLLAFSGGLASSCLLDLVKEGLKENVHKKLRFVPAVAHIIEDINCEEEDHRRRIADLTNKIQRIVKAADFKLHMVSMEETITNTSMANCNTDALSTPCEQVPTAHEERNLKKSLQTVKSTTAKEDLMQNLRIQLLTEIARQNGYTKILLGESSTRLSIKVLSKTALGKGGCIPLDIGIADSRAGHTTLVRPLREISSKEIAFYNVFQGVEADIGLTKKMFDKLSLQRQTEYFINELQVNFPSTVNTVFRTGDKLKLNEDLRLSSEHCRLCQAPILQSQETRPETCETGNDQGNVTSEKESVKERLKTPRNRLCYGCAITAVEMNVNLDELTFLVREKEHSTTREEELHDQIKEFLLE